MFSYLSQVKKKKITSKGEYRLADAIALMIKDGEKLKADTVDKWLDCGKPETLLETNQYLLKTGKNKVAKTKDSVIKDPVYVELGTEIEGSIIGPNVSIAKGAKIKNSVISNTIVGDDAVIENAVIESSLVGNKAEIRYQKKKLNVGDSTQILSH